MYESEHFSTVYLVWKRQSVFNSRDMLWRVHASIRLNF